jgi:hypothetical protein
MVTVYVQGGAGRGEGGESLVNVFERAGGCSWELLLHLVQQLCVGCLTQDVQHPGLAI